MKCQRCKKEFEENKIQEHHLHPRFMDNPKGNGAKLQLCEKCHNILHLTMSKWLFYLIPDKKDSIIYIINKTNRWLNYG